MSSTWIIRWFAVLAAAMLSACASIAPPPPLISDTAEERIRTRFQEAVLAMADDTGLSAGANSGGAPAPNPGRLSLLMSTGMALSDLACKNYFRNLGRATQNYAFARQETALTGGVVASLQGLTGVSAKIVSITAGLFSFTSASMENHADAYLFSPETSNLQELVDSARRAYREAATDLPTSYGAAIERLRDYDKLCEVQTIRRLVNESVATAKPIADGFRTPVLTAAERSAIAAALPEKLNVAVLTMDEALIIYWYLVKPTGSSMNDELARKVSGPWEASQIADAVSGAKSSLRKAFAQAIARDNGELNAALDELAERLKAKSHDAANGAAAPTEKLQPKSTNTNISVRIGR